MDVYNTKKTREKTLRTTITITTISTTIHSVHFTPSHLGVFSIDKRAHHNNHIRPGSTHYPEQVVQRLVLEAVACRKRPDSGEHRHRFPPCQIRSVLKARKLSGRRRRRWPGDALDYRPGHHAPAGTIDTLHRHHLPWEQREVPQLAKVQVYALAATVASRALLGGRGCAGRGTRGVFVKVLVGSVNNMGRRKEGKDTITSSVLRRVPRGRRPHGSSRPILQRQQN